MYRKYALITGFSVGVGLASQALADEIADGVAAMPGNVEDVRIGGTWEAGNKSGAYRIIIARSGGEAITARLFVQWIAYGDNGEATVDKSIEIKEVGDLHLDIADYTSESDADGLSVFIDALGQDGKADESYELHLISPTDYRFGPSTN
jgi:hypothetical protein